MKLVASLEALLFLAPEPGVGRGARGRAADQRGGRDGRGRRARGDLEGRGLVLRRVAGGLALASHPDAEEAARRLLARPRTPSLTPAQAETLSIVAYLQPVSRPEVARIRGVASESATSALVDRGLIEEAGRSQFGAVLYRTTPLFLKLFGLDSPEALPDVAQWDPIARGGRDAARPPAARRRGPRRSRRRPLDVPARGSRRRIEESCRRRRTERPMRNFSRARGLRAGVRKLTLALGAMMALGGLTFFGLAQAQTPPVTFSVYPVPGTLTASAKTQITFRGGDAAAIGAVTVTGSKSGAHPGTLKPHSDGHGASFVPNKPFSEGEKVTVAHGPAGRRRDQRRLLVHDRRRDAAHAAPGGGAGRRPRHGAVLQDPPGPRPAVGDRHHQQARDAHPGLVFLAPKAGARPGRPDDHRQRAASSSGSRPMKGKVAADFRVQTYQGKPVLTWWEGQLFVGDGDGVGQIYDSSYKPHRARCGPATATRSTCTSSRSRRATPRWCWPTSATTAA